MYGIAQIIYGVPLVANEDSPKENPAAGIRHDTRARGPGQDPGREATGQWNCEAAQGS